MSRTRRARPGRPDLIRSVPRKKGDPDGRMTVVEHLTELRSRLMISLAAVVVAATVCFIFASPDHRSSSHYYEDATDGSANAFIFTGPLDAFATRLKVATYGGIVLAMPVWLWQLWRFITPGLNPNEKKYAVPFVSRRSSCSLGGWWRSSPCSRRSTSCSARRRRPQAAPHRRQVPVARVADDRGLRVGVRVPGGADVPAHRARHHHCAAPALAALGDRLIFAFAAVITPEPGPVLSVLMALPLYLFYEAVHPHRAGS